LLGVREPRQAEGEASRGQGGRNRAAERCAVNRLIYEPHIWHIYEVLRWESKHEVLHFLSGFAAGFLGCWAYAIFARWRIRRAMARAEGSARLAPGWIDK
jgi:hypothetical protein